MNMLHKRQLLLLQKSLDNDLSSWERKRLTRLLDNNAEARELLHHLRTAADAVKNLPTVEPPPGLRSSILEGASATGHRLIETHPGFLEILRQLVDSPRPGIRMAFVAGALGGVMLAIVAYGVVLDGKTPPELAVGTIARPDASLQWNIRDSVTLDSDKIQGYARLFTKSDEVMVSIDARCETELRVETLNDDSEGQNEGRSRSATIEIAKPGPLHLTLVRTRREFPGTSVLVRLYDGKTLIKAHRLLLPPQNS